jgi:hypothetical protein
MAEQAGCCEGEGRAATVAVLVLSIIVFMANIYAMIVAIDIHAYYWIMTYHFVGTIGVLVATSVFACRCCGEGGFPLRRLGQALAAYVVLCGVVCFVAVLAAKDGAIEDNCAESRECDLSVLFGCPKENQGFYQCVDDPDPVEQVLNDNTCGGKLYAPKWHNWGCDRDDDKYLCRAFCTKKACTDYCNPLSDDDEDQCGDRGDCYTIEQWLDSLIRTCVVVILFLLVPAAALAGVAVQAKEPERVNPSHPSIEMRQMPPIVAAVPLPAGMQPYQAQPGQPPQMVPAPVMATVQEPQAKVVNEANATML